VNCCLEVCYSTGWWKYQAQVSNLVFDESEESGVGGLTLSREEGINNWCHDVVDGNVYAVYLVDQVWTGVKSTITKENVWICYVPQVFSSDKDYDAYCWLIIIEE
jgi:hypothetical protein